ncbi:class I SAM-dependent rRNA methyltransferase [Massilibacterium senegalense]|uniref:class I SAM-dependent rRNA methyltransferase n=1 Tax=Massilibacterium senegalense TaxID=1632858 RepID=UPI00078330F9|nr:class I SAM-dependent rRNA methyltransferase [Massilibacterium senegalense]
MSKEIKVKVKANTVQGYKRGYPLMTKESIVHERVLQEEGTIIQLVDEKNQFIAKGYVGKQNKGYGWVLSHQSSEKIDVSFFERKIKASFEKRKTFFHDANTTAFRVFNGEGDGIGGLTIDYFDEYYVINWYSEGIYSFKELIIQSLQNSTTFKAIYEKKRFAKKGQYIEEDDFVTGARGEFPIIVKENGMNFAVDLNDGAMVGIFLDQRNVRRRIRDVYAKGKNVLNMFSYTGAFSVAAALGGAMKTTSVDVANRSLAKTIEQFRVNGIDAEAQDIIVEDVFHYFKYAARKNKTFDLVILDPPSFARTKKHTFSAAKDYTNLLKDTLAITEKNGVIVASTNCSTFDMKKFKRFIDQACKETGRPYKILEEHSLPEDFRTIPSFKEGNYLKVVFIQVK